VRCVPETQSLPSGWGFEGHLRDPGHTRFWIKKLPLKGSLCGSGQPVLFRERDTDIFLFESENSKISGKQENLSKQQNPSSNENQTEKSLGFLLKEIPKKLPWSTETTFQGQLITSKSDRTWVPGAALLTPILKEDTLPVKHVACLWMWVLLYSFFIYISAYAYVLKSKVHCGSALGPDASRLPEPLRSPRATRNQPEPIHILFYSLFPHFFFFETGRLCCNWRAGVWRHNKLKTKNQKAGAGWLKGLTLVRTTPWADSSVQLESTVPAIFPCVALSW